MSDRMTRRAEAVLTFLRRYVAEHGIAPSYREIVLGAGLSSTSTACHYLDRLEQQGKIRRFEGKARAIVIVKED